MRVAVISDIHGNADALEAVLADIERAGVDAILNLGDHFYGPLDPGRTWARLAALSAHRPVHAITGNTDHYFLADEGSDRLAREAVDWLGALPATTVFADSIFLSHGTPASDEIYWLDREDGPDRFRVSTPEEVEAELPDARYPLYCCGHTHVARVVTLGDGRIVFNPGSVGRPSFTMSDPQSAGRLSPAAAYALVARDAEGWRVDLRQVPYDHMAASRLARANGSAEWARDLAEGRRR